jgi:hypothetical protein
VHHSYLLIFVHPAIEFAKRPLRPRPRIRFRTAEPRVSTVVHHSCRKRSSTRLRRVGQALDKERVLHPRRRPIDGYSLLQIVQPRQERGRDLVQNLLKVHIDISLLGVPYLGSGELFGLAHVLRVQPRVRRSWLVWKI